MREKPLSSTEMRNRVARLEGCEHFEWFDYGSIEHPEEVFPRCCHFCKHFVPVDRECIIWRCDDA